MRLAGGRLTRCRVRVERWAGIAGSNLRGTLTGAIYVVHRNAKGGFLARASAAAAWLAIVAIIAGGSSPSAIGAEPPAFGGAIQPYRPLPEAKGHDDLVFESLDGLPRPLSSFRGKVLLLNYWATWCAPCIEEMPSLDRLQAKLGGPAFEVVAVSIDRQGRKTVEPFIERLGLERLTILLDPKGATSRALGLRGLPTTLVIDREGRELGRLEGEAQWDSDAAEALLRHYIETGAAANSGSAADKR
jgi:thiol-disulfide isomerase/thioredoxin